MNSTVLKSSISVVVSLSVCVAVFFFHSVAAYAAPVVNVETTSMELVSKSRSGRTIFDYTYKASFINNGSAASNVRATVSSTNASVQIIENIVAIGDLPEGIATTSNDTFTIRIDRRIPFNSDYLSWSFEAIKPISIDVGTTDLVIGEGESLNKSYTVIYKAIDTSNKTIVFSQQISPAGGIQIITTAPASWSSTVTMDWVVNGVLSALSAGQYILTTTATILETGDMATKDTVITVLPLNHVAYILNPPLMWPVGIRVNQVEEIFFSVQLNIEENNAPEHLTLEETDSAGNVIKTVGLLFNNGLDGDVSANDAMYGATFSVSSNAEGKKYYRVSFFDGTQTAYSTVSHLAVVDFPITTAVSNPDTIIETDDPLIRVFSDRIVVIFKEGILSSQIKNIVSQVGGSIIGSIPNHNIIQIGFDEAKTLSELERLIEDYRVRSEVESAGMSTQTSIGSVVYPNDPDKGSLNNMKISRVDEIWLLAKGGNNIAVVDTGVDYNHTDLNVIKGWDFVSNDDDPMDEYECRPKQCEPGHGTHVAGIAAAIINNGQDVAGVANSKIYAIRALGGSLGGSLEELAAAIQYAASKASVVNISLGAYGELAAGEIEKVMNTKEMGTKIIVAAAGNGEEGVWIGLNKKMYPCANTNVFCVGSSSPSDTRSSFSNFGSWVDIAAPGENVLSTKFEGGTTSKSGTSMAAPLVAGVARVIWNQHPGWSAAQVKQRLLDTAFDAPGLKGKGIGKRIDAFEAFFNGDFELGLEGWQHEGTCSPKTQLGPILPKSGKKMAFCSTGPAGNQVAATLSKELNFVADSYFTIKFWYNFVSEEYPEFVGSIFNDSVTIKLIAPDGSETILAQESINSSSFSPVSGIHFEGGDDTVGQTGWKPVNRTISVTSGSGSYRIVIEDAGDDIFDTAILLDNFRLK